MAEEWFADCKAEMIEDYETEIAWLRDEFYRAPDRMMSAKAAGEKLAAGRDEVPVEEVLADWEARLELLHKEEEDLDKFMY